MLHHRRTTRVVALAAIATLAIGGTAAASTTFTAPHHGFSDRPQFRSHRLSPPGTIGKVTAVNGTSTAGTCGTAGTAGTVAVTAWRRSVDTVGVTPTTTFSDPGSTPASFANVCVGDVIGAVGPVADGTVTASKVYVFPPSTPPTPHGTFGTVTAVKGTTTAGTCGTAGAAGTFTVAAWKSTIDTVDVTTTTTYTEPGVTGATLANVCVGEAVGALGTVSGATVTATKVFVFPPHTPPPPQGTFGTVTAVNGTTTAGTCGTAGAAGTFTVAAWKSTIDTVDVTAATMYTDPGVTGATLANVCVGEAVGALGTVSGDTVTATKVFVFPTPPTPAPDATFRSASSSAAFGVVSSVNGTTAADTCGTAGSTGTFTVTAWRHSTDTVDVVGATSFAEPGMSGATFANVCVGSSVGVFGSTTAGGAGSPTTITAAKVFVVPSAWPTSHPTGSGSAVHGPVPAVGPSSSDHPSGPSFTGSHPSASTTTGSQPTWTPPTHNATPGNGTPGNGGGSWHSPGSGGPGGYSGGSGDSGESHGGDGGGGSSPSGWSHGGH